MGIGGVLVGRGEMEFWPLLAIGVLGTTVGNYVWYWIGDRWGYQRLEPIVAKHGRWLTLDWEHIEKGSAFFRSHGQWVVFFMRFSPFLRTIISLPAGLSHMNVWRFLLFTAAGATVWIALLIEGGRRLAPYIQRYETIASWVMGGIFALILAFYLYRVMTWKPRKD